MRKINHFINGSLSERLDQLDKLSYLISQYTNMPLQNRIWPMLRNRRLLILTDDPHFATHARFAQKSLCQYLNKQSNLKLSGIDVKLVALPLLGNNRKKERAAMSQQTVETLTCIAQQIEDESLRQALIRVALVNRHFPEHTLYTAKA